MIELKWADDEQRYIHPKKRRLLLRLGEKKYHLLQKEGIYLFLRLNKLLGRKKEIQLAKGQRVAAQERKSELDLQSINEFVKNQFPALSVSHLQSATKKAHNKMKKSKEAQRKLKKIKKELSDSQVHYMPLKP